MILSPLDPFISAYIPHEMARGSLDVEKHLFPLRLVVGFGFLHHPAPFDQFWRVPEDDFARQHETAAGLSSVGVCATSVFGDDGGVFTVTENRLHDDLHCVANGRRIFAFEVDADLLRQACILLLCFRAILLDHHLFSSACVHCDDVIGSVCSGVVSGMQRLLC